MTEVKVFTKQRRCIACPECGKGEFEVGHMIEAGGTFGPWFCKLCGFGFEGKADKGGPITIEAVTTRKKITRDLIRLRIEDIRNLYFEVEAMEFTDCDNDHDTKNYYYTGHSCAVNFLRGVIETFTDNEPDPHGIFELIASRPAPEARHEGAFESRDVMSIEAGRPNPRLTSVS